MATENLDAANLAAVDFGGIINEDVMALIWDISNIPLPFSDRAGSDSVANSFTEWTQDRLQAVDLDNARIDGEDTIGNQDTNTGKRVGNHAQISTKTVKVSTRARESDTIGFSDTLAYQVMMRQRELRRDVEAITLENQASIADDGSATAGRVGGLPSWLESTTSRGVGGADGGYSSGIVSAPTEGAARGLTETLVRDIAQAVWELGGNPTILMSVASVIRGLSEYMFTDSARIATLRREASGVQAQDAIGSVNVFLTDFGVTLDMIPNRLQQTYQSAEAGPPVANVFFLDFEFLRHGFLHGFRVEPLSKTGLADNRQMAVDWTLKVLNEEAHGLIADIDPTVPVTQS